MPFGATPTEWLTLLVLVGGPGVVATVLWSPVLVAGRLRALFRSLPLTRVTAVNYAAKGIALSVPWLLGYGWALEAIGGAPEAARTGEPMIDVAVQLTGLYVVALPVAAAAGLPHLGIDWDPASYESTTWVLLVVASGWYAAIFAVPAFLFALVVSLPT